MSSSHVQLHWTSIPVPNLIAKLDDLHDTSSTVFELIQWGGAAVPLLADALLRGRPRSVSEPRCCLVRVLADLDANDVLLEYLRSGGPIDDPEIRFAEDSVINAAARALKLDFSADAYSTLFSLAERRCLPGVLESLAMYRRIETIPCFIRALESDLSRQAATESLESFGQAAKPYLLTEAFRREPNPPDSESTSSRHRRSDCLKLLERLHLSDLDRERLLSLLAEQDCQMVMSVGQILLASKNKTAQAAASRCLNAFRSQIAWPLRDECIDLTNKLGQASENI
jgi:hypothetical protein